jgi:hypothetical protein
MKLNTVRHSYNDLMIGQKLNLCDGDDNLVCDVLD